MVLDNSTIAALQCVHHFFRTLLSLADASQTLSTWRPPFESDDVTSDNSGILTVNAYYNNSKGQQVHTPTPNHS